MLCPYCAQEKADSDMTDEHVIPRALGGSLRPTNPLMIRVCRRCNSACGRHVDGRFVRSFIVHNFRTAAMMRHHDPHEPPTVPLSFFGPMDGWSDTQSVC